MALHAVQPGSQILHIKTPTFPQFRFEWHPGTQRVYLIRGTIGEPIAFEVKTHGDAHNAVLIFLRGYRQRSLEIDEPAAVIHLT